MGEFDTSDDLAIWLDTARAVANQRRLACVYIPDDPVRTRRDVSVYLAKKNDL